MKHLTQCFRVSSFQKASQASYIRSKAHSNQDPSKFHGSEPLGADKSKDYYHGLRIYQNHSWFELINLLGMTTVCSNDYFVNNCHKFYTLGRKVFGPNMTDLTISNTIGRVFTGGDTVHTMESFVRDWKHKNVDILIGYNNEIAPGQEAPLEELDHSAQTFANTVDIAAKREKCQNGIALKLSCVIPPEVTKKASEAQLKLRAVFSKGYGNLEQTFTARELKDRFHESQIVFTFQEFQDFMKTLLGKEVQEGNLDQVTVTKFEWLRDIHMFYVEDPNKTMNSLLRKFADLSENDLIELDRFSQRIKLTFDKVLQKEVLCIIDAEQSYYQEAFDSITTQYMNIYNKKNAHIVNTYQNYLKVTKDKIAFEIERCKSLNLCFGIKMVRGAYMVEERALASKYNYEDPIQPNIEATHNNYNSNLEFVMANWIQGSRMIVASHNEHSVNLAKSLIKKYDINQTKGSVSFAQLLGLGDHLTFALRDQGFSVAKLVVFGPTPILIPFFIRRAQETRQMLSSTRFQQGLVFDEIFKRLSLRK